MANNIVGQVMGGKKEVLDGVETVSEARTKLGLGADYTASINGDPAESSDTLSDGDFVTFSKSVKGGC